MTERETAARQLLEAMGALEVPPRMESLRSGQRDRVAVQIERQLARMQGPRASRRFWRQHWLAWSVAASVLLLVGGWALLRPPPPGTHVAPAPAYGRLLVAEGTTQVIRDEGSRTSVSGRFDLRRSDRIETGPHSRAKLMLARSVAVALAPETRLRLPGDPIKGRESVRLARGEAEFKVAPIGKPRSFAVVTPHAQIVVHGTRFLVAVRDHGSKLQTRVTVAEGIVGVTSHGRTVMLSQGQEWTSTLDESRAGHGEERGAAAGAPTDSSEERLTSSRRHAARRPPAQDLDQRPRAVSTLAAETRAYTAAMDAKRRGDDAAALKGVDAFLAQYPLSPLAHNARVERFRMLKRLGRRQAAAAEARRYMADHPDGFARDEARELAIPPADSLGKGEP